MNKKPSASARESAAAPTSQLAQLQAKADAACALLHSLAHPLRLMILCHLGQGEHSVGALARELEARPSTLSQHLALMRREGLVSPRRDGQSIYYSLSSEPASHIIAALARCYCPA